MTAVRRLSRRDGRPAPPVRLLHLGLGNFFRAHAAWYTEHAPDAAGWGYAAFAGGRQRVMDALGVAGAAGAAATAAASGGAGVAGAAATGAVSGGGRPSLPSVASALARQGGCYSLVQRGAEGDELEVVSSVSAVHPADDEPAWAAAWAAAWASPDLSAVTLTITEAGYRTGPATGLELDAPDVAADVARLRADPGAGTATATGRLVTATAPGRLVAGMAARRRAGMGPVALVPCDNMPANGELARRVVLELAERVDPGLAGWIADSVSVVSTVVDRITPRATDADTEAVARRTGRHDQAVVVTEPFAEWVLAGAFPAGRPDWEAAGAQAVGDVTPYEHRKLWLLNGAHSLLAYAGSARGHRTVAAAMTDDTCCHWVEEWWDEAVRHLPQPVADLATYRMALERRFSNPRIADPLDRVAEDGSHKLPVRVLPVVRAERAAGRVPVASARILGAWVRHLRGAGAPVRDARGAHVVALAGRSLRQAVPAVLGALDPALPDDPALVAAVIHAVAELAGAPAPAAASGHRCGTP